MPVTGLRCSFSGELVQIKLIREGTRIERGAHELAPEIVK